ncbi:hypothetical protein [Falsiroseomonas sp. CW058]|uniref:hypothetical protein n=1 Tax=Falsiroseomonas sp. CW058 TaxID=3388664 RepID=UPI003D319FC2
MSERLRQRFGTAAGAAPAPAEQPATPPTLITSATVRTPLVQPALVATVAAEPHRPEEAEAEEYQAFGQEYPETDGTIELRFGEEECWVLFRHFLKRVEASGDSLLTLICTDSVVTISGQGLRELRRLLRAGKLDFVQEYDARRFAPLKPDQPVVENIAPMTAGQIPA